MAPHDDSVKLLVIIANRVAANCLVTPRTQSEARSLHLLCAQIRTSSWPATRNRKPEPQPQDAFPNRSPPPRRPSPPASPIARNDPHFMIMIMASAMTLPPNGGRRLLLPFAAVLLLFAYNAQASGFGRCPKYPSMPKFNMTKVSE